MDNASFENFMRGERGKIAAFHNVCRHRYLNEPAAAVIAFIADPDGYPIELNESVAADPSAPADT